MFMKMAGMKVELPKTKLTTYAIDAIRDLEPKVIVTISDITGGSGGDLFNYFLHLLGVPTYIRGMDHTEATIQSLKKMAEPYNVAAFILRGVDGPDTGISSVAAGAGLPGSEIVTCLIVLVRGEVAQADVITDISFADNFPKKWISQYSKLGTKK